MTASTVIVGIPDPSNINAAVTTQGTYNNDQGRVHRMALCPHALTRARFRATQVNIMGGTTAAKRSPYGWSDTFH